MDQNSGRGEILGRLGPSAPRRLFAATVIGLLAALLGWVGLFEPIAGHWRVVSLGFGTAVAVAGLRVWQATAGAILLTPDGLFTEAGEEVAALDRIASVDRGAFAFKPSNGFVVRTRAPLGRAWAPGLWWRLGRRVGVGGVTASVPARAMADMLAAMIAERDAGR